MPGGRLSELYSARLVLLVSVLLNILASLLTPLASGLDHRLLAALRLVAGAGGGLSFPALNVMISAWAPPQERASVASICFGGASLGTVISTLTSGIEDELDLELSFLLFRSSDDILWLGICVLCSWQPLLYLVFSLAWPELAPW